MEAKLKKTLRALSLELRHILEGTYDKQGKFHPGDLEQRLNAIGIWRDRCPKPIEELTLSPEDLAARQVVDAFIQFRDEAGVSRPDAIAEFVRESAYTWANRLLTLRCMEARAIIDEVILQKDSYGGRSMVHNRFARRNPDACTGDDDGLFAVLMDGFETRSLELPGLFNPKAPAIALRPSVAALKRCVALLSGREVLPGQDAATDAVFEAADALGWAYQYWNAEEKDRVFEKVRTKKGAKIEGADIVPATQLYTDPYMVKFLVQNSLGASWMGMYPESRLYEQWEYYVRDADRAPVALKVVEEITFLDPACGSGHFLLEAFDLFYPMYREEGELTEPREICAAILNCNLFGIDIDERAVQIATAALWMKAKEQAPDLEPEDLTTFHDHLVATNIRLPRGKDHLEEFLKRYPEDEPLRTALLTVFEGLENAPELGSLLQIEEPVEKELRYLKGREEEGFTEKVQLNLLQPVAVQTVLPMGVESFEEWKEKTLNRLMTHFEQEAEAADRIQAFFGESVGKGLALFDLLAQRHDVVAANPPYMGSKNMGSAVKSYIAKHYKPGKGDIYTAFILRCCRLTQDFGRVAMVTQQAWMFLSTFSNLRAIDKEKIGKLNESEFKGLLRETAIETLVHLGSNAFGEVSGEVVNTVLFTLSNQPPDNQHHLTAFRLVSLKSVAEKTSSLIKSIKLSKSSIKFRQLYSFFLEIKNSSIVYWLSQNLLEVISRGITLERQREVVKGISTAANPRFIRFLWETSYLQKRWKVYAKGEGYKKWFGLQIHTFDWEYDGIRLKAYNSELYGGASWTKNLRNLNLFNHSGIVAAKIASGSLGFRISQEHTGFDNAAIFVDIPNEIDSTALLGHLNTRVSTYVVRALNPSIIFEPGYVGKIPLPSNNLLESIIPLAQFCIELSKLESSKSLIEKNFQYNQNFDLYKHQALRHLGEGFLEYQAVQALVLDNVSLKLLIEETGTPAGWFPLIPGYDSLPSSCALEPEIPNKIIELFEISKRCVFTREEISLLKQKLLHLYQAGQGIKSETEIEEKEEELIEMLEDEEEVHEEIGAHHSIPNETFIEELSVKLEIHPISVYWLLKEGREREGWRCIPEEKRFIEDQFIVMVLRLLGHRWHKQIEAGELVPDWADQDGVIPISKGTNKQALGDRVQERIAAEFPNSTVASIAAEFEEIVGTSLEKWLGGAFFKRHISQFKKRPIAWQIESSPITSSRSNRANPAFSCLIYYHKLDADLLPKLRSQYVGILRQSYETELRNLEAMFKEQRSTDQVARILQIPNWIEELKTLEDSLYQVSTIGFGPDFLKPRLRQLAIDDATLCLKARWLRKLMQVIQTDPLTTWMDAAIATELHPDFAQWIETAFSHLDHHCSQVGSQPPNAEDLEQDPTAPGLIHCMSRKRASISWATRR